jgi:hypothetical protein
MSGAPPALPTAQASPVAAPPALPTAQTEAVVASPAQAASLSVIQNASAGEKYVFFQDAKFRNLVIDAQDKSCIGRLNLDGGSIVEASTALPDNWQSKISEASAEDQEYLKTVSIPYKFSSRQ